MEVSFSDTVLKTYHKLPKAPYKKVAIRSGHDHDDHETGEDN